MVETLISSDVDNTRTHFDNMLGTLLIFEQKIFTLACLLPFLGER